MPAPTTRWVWFRGMRPGTCRDCHQEVTFAMNRDTGNWAPYDGPLVALETGMFETTGRTREQAMKIDLKQLHLVTCPKKRGDRGGFSNAPRLDFGGRR